MSSFAITWSPIVFGFALFLNSALLFLVQPLLGRTLQPLLGGNPLAWKTCLVFFQSTLLAGYIYADLVHRFRGLRWQPWLQLFLMVVAIAGAFADEMLKYLMPRLNSVETWPILSVICLLIVVIGLPYFVLSAVGPLMTRWFAHLDHPNASDPYYLFVASNLGGLTGLIVYVLIFEPNAALGGQWLSWKLAFMALTVLVGLVALCAWRSPRNPELEPPEKPTDPNAPLVAQLIGRGPATWPRRLYWFSAAGLPVALMMGLTDYLTLDLAPTPILWTVPIAIYLFAFSQAFARFSIYDKGSFVVKLIVQLLFGLCLCVALSIVLVSLVNMNHPGDRNNSTLTAACVILFGMVLLVPSSWLTVAQPISALIVVFLQANVFKLAGAFMPTVFLYVVCYYFTIRLCLNLLANDRPVASALTTYYSWIGLGGLAGGLFQLGIAPLLFRTDYLEFAFAAALACTLRPAWLANGLTDWLASKLFLTPQDSTERRTKIARVFDFALPILVTAIGAALNYLMRSDFDAFLFGPGEHFVSAGIRRLLADVPLVLAMLLAATLIARPLRFGLALAGIVAVCWIGQGADSAASSLLRQRSAFGTLRVSDLKFEDEAPIFTERILTYGNIPHSSCITEPPAHLRHPTMYYHRKGPVGQVMRNLDWFGPSNVEINNAQRRPEFWLTQNRDNAKDDARIAASLIGMAASGGLDTIATAWSEPPYAFVGLGVGSLFAYAHPYQWVDAYELDPAIIALSEGEQPMFHCYQSAQKRGVCANIHVGDGRRLLTRAGREGLYHVLFIDAFNGGSIPTHLFTRQAIETYFQKLAPDGVVCIHMANPHLELNKVLDMISRRLDIAMQVLEVKDNTLPAFKSSEWVVLARNKAVLQKWNDVGGFVLKANGQPGAAFRPRDAERLLWTDERASLFAAMRNEQMLPAFVYGLLGVLLGFAAIMAIVEIVANSAAQPKRK